ASVRRAGLFGIGDKKRLILGEVVHGGSGGEGDGVLRAAMQHHQQWQRPAGMAGRDVEPVSAGTGSVGVGEGVKPAGRVLRRRVASAIAVIWRASMAVSLLGRAFHGLLAGRPACREGPAVRAAVMIAAAHAVRAARAALTAAGARKAPSTSTEAIVARASWGE